LAQAQKTQPGIDEFDIGIVPGMAEVGICPGRHNLLTDY
jgi:hypothetical protein